MAKEQDKHAKIEDTSPDFVPGKKGRALHLACADTLDTADVIDRVEYQTSADDGKTWRTLAFVTGATAGSKDGGPATDRPGVVVALDVGRATDRFRTVITHSTGKPLKAVAREKT